MSLPPIPPVPLGQQLITADDVRGDPAAFAALLNNIIIGQNQKINELIGSGGAIQIPTALDMQGNRIKNVSDPKHPLDAISASAASARYSPGVVGPQLEANAQYPLQTYRALGSKTQQESNTTYLNRLGNTSPDANTSTVTFGNPSGGFVPVTISAGFQNRADGTTLPYIQFNDSVPQPATFNINTISRLGNLVTGNTTGANTLQTGNTVFVAGVGDSTYNGYFVLTFVGTGGSPPGPVFQYNNAGGNTSSSGGTISLFGVYYYVMDPAVGQVYRVGPFPVDTQQNRLNALQDRLAMIAVAVVTGSGGDTANTAAGATSPIANVGGGNRILSTQ